MNGARGLRRRFGRGASAWRGATAWAGALVLVLIVTLRLAGCGGATSEPTDASGGAPSGSADGVRIVALSPAVAQILRDVGTGERIVGRHGFDSWTDARVPSCGEQGQIDYEALLRVRPTHVLLQWPGAMSSVDWETGRVTREPLEDGALPGRLREMARTHGWTVRNFNVLTLADIEGAATVMERMFGEEGGEGVGARDPAPDDAMTGVERLRHALRRREGINGERIGPVLMLVATEEPAALGPGSCHHEMLCRVGGLPALQSGAPYVRLDVEDVIRLAPGALIVWRPIRGKDDGTGIGGRIATTEEYRALLGPLDRRDIPAVAAGRVGVIEDPLCLLPSTGLWRGAEAMAWLLLEWSSEEGGGVE